MIGFWISKCLWNHLIEMLQLGEGVRGEFVWGAELVAPNPSAGARKRGATGPSNFLVPIKPDMQNIII